MRIAAALLAVASLAAVRADAQAYSDPGSGLGLHGALTTGDAGRRAPLLGAHFRTRLTGGLGLELSVSYHQQTFRAANEDVLRVQMAPVEGSVQVFPLPHGRIQPVVFAGGGYFLVRARGLGANAEAGGKTEHRLGGHVGVGLDARATPSLSVTLEARRVFLSVGAVDDLRDRFGTTTRSGFNRFGVSLTYQR